jgi:uncharacterized C2H2 Zn-finger protein
MRAFPFNVSESALYESVPPIISSAKNNPVLESNTYEEACSVRRKYSCDKCGNMYKRKSHFNRHVNLECGVEPQFRCPHCPNRYRRNSTLIYHIQRHHGTDMWLSNTFWRLEILAFSAHSMCWQLSHISIVL